jgi:hypothetical protein
LWTVAGSILASSAILALVVGLAAQSTLSNFVAGILIAFTQPLRLGDAVAVAGASGTVEGRWYRNGGGFIPASSRKLATECRKNGYRSPQFGWVGDRGGSP